MIDRSVPGHPEAMFVTSAEAAAARLWVKRRNERGEEIDPAFQAIADALPESALYEESEMDAADVGSRIVERMDPGIDRRVPGHPEDMFVTSAEVAAARLWVKRRNERGEEIDPAFQAIADALPESALYEEDAAGVR